MGESVFAKSMYRNCPIIFPNRVSYIELVELDILDFDISAWIGCMLSLLLLIVG